MTSKNIEIRGNFYARNIDLNIAMILREKKVAILEGKTIYLNRARKLSNYEQLNEEKNTSARGNNHLSLPWLL